MTEGVVQPVSCDHAAAPGQGQSHFVPVMWQLIPELRCGEDDSETGGGEYQHERSFVSPVAVANGDDAKQRHDNGQGAVGSFLGRKKMGVHGRCGEKDGSSQTVEKAEAGRKDP